MDDKKLSVDMNAIIDAAPDNQIIQNTMMKMNLKLDHYKSPVCSVSGGSDSDTMIDIIERVRGDRLVTYVFFNTGIECKATLRHLDELDAKYDIEIVRRKATVPVPKGCQDYGLPFLSKETSQKIKQLQAHGFEWRDEPLDALVLKYPHAKDGVRWWCNARGEEYGIARQRYLKEFMIAHPPTFKISDVCCKGAKKNPAGRFYREVDAGMKILGLRQAEGGVRATAYTSCFSLDNTMGNYRPLWFWTDTMKAEYKEHYGLTYSDCYEVWGFKRTGCAGCPFNSRFEDDLKTMEQYEPQMALAANNIFGKSYEYTKAYRKFRDRMKARAKAGVLADQMSFDDIEAEEQV